MAEGNELKIKIEDKWYSVGSMELGEMVEIEEAFDTPFDELNLNRAKVLAHLVWIMLRREDPSFTLEQAYKIKLESISGEDVEEANGNGHPPTKPRKRAATGTRK